MTTTRKTRSRHMGLSLFLLVTLAGCAASTSVSVRTNVPLDRLSYGTYTYRILRVDNTGEKFTLEQISDEFKASEAFRENRHVDSERGKELRLVGLKKEGSPLVSQKNEGNELVTRKDDLYKAESIFMHGIYMCEVSAGVTASQGQFEDALFNDAKRNLEEVLKGLRQ